MPPNKSNPPKIYTHLVDPDDHVYAYAEGSYQTLDNGDAFIGYGLRPVLKELSKNGADVRWSAEFGYVNNNNTVSSYLTYNQIWHATPSAELSLIVDDAGTNDALSSCASWFGQARICVVEWSYGCHCVRRVCWVTE